MSELARNSGVIAAIDPAMAPALAGAVDQAKYKTDASDIYAGGKVPLLDEPLAARDLKLRKRMQITLKRLHEDRG